uniref:PDZ domain-containing protein n=1 Tax=Hanusia phi TaxID=3032 RepID=A0A7S0EHE7_9CRYP
MVKELHLYGFVVTKLTEQNEPECDLRNLIRLNALKPKTITVSKCDPDLPKMSNNFEEISGRISSFWENLLCCQANSSTTRMIRTTPSMRGMKHPMAVNQQPQGGVGIVFLQDHRQDLYVHFLVENGPAHLSGVISPGDELRSIDSRNIQEEGTDLAMLSGPHGSFVTLSFRRKSIDHFNSSKDYTVQLTRNANFYPDVIAVPPVEERVVV